MQVHIQVDVPTLKVNKALTRPERFTKCEIINFPVNWKKTNSNILLESARKSHELMMSVTKKPERKKGKQSGQYSPGQF